MCHVHGFRKPFCKLSLSLRSKRFRGVFCTKKPISVFWISAKWGESTKKKKKKEAEEEKKEGDGGVFLPLPSFVFFFPISARFKQ